MHKKLFVLLLVFFILFFNSSCHWSHPFHDSRLSLQVYHEERTPQNYRTYGTGTGRIWLLFDEMKNYTYLYASDDVGIAVLNAHDGAIVARRNYYFENLYWEQYPVLTSKGQILMPILSTTTLREFDGCVYLLDPLTGAQLWKYCLFQNAGFGNHHLSLVTDNRDTLYYFEQKSNNISAIKIGGNAPMWSVHVGSTVGWFPNVMLLHGQYIYFAHSDKTNASIIKIDINKKQIVNKWPVRLDGALIHYMAIEPNGTAVIFNSYEESTQFSSLHAMDTNTGKILWTFKGFKSIAIKPMISKDGRDVYVLEDWPQNVIHKFEFLTGRFVWRQGFNRDPNWKILNACLLGKDDHFAIIEYSTIWILNRYNGKVLKEIKLDSNSGREAFCDYHAVYLASSSNRFERFVF